MFRGLSVILGVCFLFVAGVANAADKKETVSQMMQAAISHYNKVGQEQAFKDFAVKDSEYNHGEYYIFVTDLKNSKLVFHGANERLVGKNLTKLKDTDGKSFVIAMREVANGPGEGWVDYKWPHPVTKKIAQKNSYVKTSGDVYFVIGYFE
ncbi:MAG: cache domain-containing protein [Sneathiella sp.]|nr:cache domain-containing protein [Sneathiella sp.]